MIANPSDLEERRKALIVGVFVLLIGIVLIFGLIQFRSSVHRPFAKRLNTAEGPSLADQKSIEETERLALTQKDTDQDGLSDYDELYVTLTSPYLPDSDSDTISDKEEVEKGQDPNCPKGTTCAAEAPAPVATPSPATPLIPAIQPQAESLAPGITLPPLITGKADANELRAVLKKAGVAEELLATMDDATLEQLYKETFQEISTESMMP